MNDNVKRELKMLFILFGTGLIIFGGFIFFRHWENRLKISPLNHSTFHVPATSNIQKIIISEKNSCLSGYTAQHQFETKVLKWIQDATPLSVTLPKLGESLVSHGCGLSYTNVYLSTKTGDHFRIYPAFYISKNAISSNPRYVFHYVKNVIEIDDNNSHKYFFKSQNFYEWLMNN